MSDGSKVERVAQAWTGLVDALGLDDTAVSAATDFLERVAAYYRYGLTSMVKLAATRLEEVRDAFGALTPAELTNLAGTPGAAQVIWWVREAAPPDPALIEYLARRATERPEPRLDVVAGELGYADRLPIEWGRTITALPAAEGALATEKVERALDLIDRACPWIGEQQRRYSGLIVLRGATDDRRLYSVSNVRAVGITLLCNVQSGAVGVDEIADRLWHESIHDLLYMVQFSSPIFTSTDAALQTVVSPWTGVELTVANYLDACFVWYGLRNFWSRPAAVEAFGDDAYRLRDVAATGFDKDPLVDYLTPEQRRCIEPEALAALDLITRRTA